MGKCINLIGKRFGRLIVIQQAGREKFGEILWLCKCDCGNEKITSSSRLRKGKCTSCGCYQKEAIVKAKRKHGMFGTRIYSVWATMIQRCSNPHNSKYKNYGARGISVCKEWSDSFEAFYEWSMSNGYADNLTIDRINVDGNYEPANCRWIGMIDQENNRTNNVLITINGITKTRTEWCRINGIKPQIACQRVFSGWNEIDAVTKPVNKKRRKIN